MASKCASSGVYLSLTATLLPCGSAIPAPLHLRKFIPYSLKPAVPSAYSCWRGHMEVVASRGQPKAWAPAPYSATSCEASVIISQTRWFQEASWNGSALCRGIA